MKETPIRISSELWTRTWLGLRSRGKGERETLCIWAGRRGREFSEVQEIIFLDDLPGVEGFALFHRVSKTAISEVFKRLHSKELDLIADVHTHPRTWVGLSETDMDHPLEYRVGFVSIVLPQYATTAPSMAGIGFHIYVGSSCWHSSLPEETKTQLLVGIGEKHEHF